MLQLNLHAGGMRGSRAVVRRASDENWESGSAGSCDRLIVQLGHWAMLSGRGEKRKGAGYSLGLKAYAAYYSA